MIVDLNKIFISIFGVRRYQKNGKTFHLWTKEFTMVKMATVSLFYLWTNVIPTKTPIESSFEHKKIIELAKGTYYCYMSSQLQPF